MNLRRSTRGHAGAKSGRGSRQYHPGPSRRGKHDFIHTKYKSQLRTKGLRHTGRPRGEPRDLLTQRAQLGADRRAAGVWDGGGGAKTAAARRHERSREGAEDERRAEAWRRPRPRRSRLRPGRAWCSRKDWELGMAVTVYFVHSYMFTLHDVIQLVRKRRCDGQWEQCSQSCHNPNCRLFVLGAPGLKRYGQRSGGTWLEGSPKNPDGNNGRLQRLRRTWSLIDEAGGACG
ncbi:hypothetical protein GGX14DRAFT_404991 [Mycena pura]|uniref:Uncharacterized protein n=1 Tax=Mycena pura TaxID=153505 RepID=A0AAD6UTE1_9AGAR|nr:hypothetical protein GGX14DRAFT_404991 [Mycena pura]